MTLQNSYKQIRNAIVAFIPKYSPVAKGGPPPIFPAIVGTGFVVREDGVVATNGHVVEALQTVPVPPGIEDDWPVKAMMFLLREEGMLEITLDVIGVARISVFDPGGKAYYGPKKGPDLGFVHLKARGLPTVEICPEMIVEEGIELATAGFPMGTDALVAPGWLHQITPTLQSGVVSAVLPFACKHPHAFAINVMTQGGASGSPVFDPDNGNVVGVLFGGLKDIARTFDPPAKEWKHIVQVPTNISYVVPAHYLDKSMVEISKMPKFGSPPDVPTLEERLGTEKLRNAIEEGRDWQEISLSEDDDDAK